MKNTDAEETVNGFIKLERTYSTLYEKTSYRAPIDYCVNRIYEYDIRMANISVMRAKQYLPEKELDKLASLPKNIRERTVGLMILDQKTKEGSSKLDKIIKKGIKRAKECLFRENGIQDAEVLSIKNDAVFVIGRKLRNTKFGSIEFVLKNTFTAYHLINGIEFYYEGKSKKFTVKGISDDVIEEPDHQDGMLKFLSQVMDYLIYDRRSDLRKYLIRFSDQYKSRKLPHQYYRELNAENVYRNSGEISYKEYGRQKTFYFNHTEANDSMICDLNIAFNYNFYILTMIRLHL